MLFYYIYRCLHYSDILNVCVATIMYVNTMKQLFILIIRGTTCHDNYFIIRILFFSMLLSCHFTFHQFSFSFHSNFFSLTFVSLYYFFMILFSCYLFSCFSYHVFFNFLSFLRPWSWSLRVPWTAFCASLSWLESRSRIPKMLHSTRRLENNILRSRSVQEWSIKTQQRAADCGNTRIFFALFLHISIFFLFFFSPDLFPL